MTAEYLGQAIPVETELQAVRVRDISLISFTPSSSNYSVTPLGSAGQYEGTAEWNGYSHVAASVYSDVDGTLYFEFRNPGSALCPALPRHSGIR